MYFVLPQWIHRTFNRFSLCYQYAPRRIFFYLYWRKTQLCKNSVHPGLPRQEQKICTKWHNPPFETVFCTWGSTAGPCPANLCKELTWGTLMGTAVIVPKVCWKKNIWTQLKTIAKLSPQNLSEPAVSFQLFFFFPAAMAEGSLSTRLFQERSEMHHIDVHWYDDAFHGSQGHKEIFSVHQEIANTELLKLKAAY